MFVTHGIGFLPQCDTIVSLSQGMITEVGSYDKLMENNGTFAEFINAYTNSEESMKDDSSKSC